MSDGHYFSSLGKFSGTIFVQSVSEGLQCGRDSITMTSDQMELIKNNFVCKTYVIEDLVEYFEDCKDTCTVNEEHVGCKSRHFAQDTRVGHGIEHLSFNSCGFLIA